MKKILNRFRDWRCFRRLKKQNQLYLDTYCFGSHHDTAVKYEWFYDRCVNCKHRSKRIYIPESLKKVESAFKYFNSALADVTKSFTDFAVASKTDDLMKEKEED